MPVRLLACALLACLPPLAIAQPAAPASPPPDLSGESIVIESLQNVLRIAADGSVTRTTTLRARMLSDAGVRENGVLSIAYSSSRETPVIDYVRVRKPGGAVVNTPVGDAQDVTMPITQAAPMYSDLKAKQLPVKALSVGDTLEYQATVTETNDEAPGSFSRTLNFTEGVPVSSEILELHAPRALYLQVKSKQVQPTIREEGQERIYRWQHETASKYPKPREKQQEEAPVELVPPMFDPDIAVTTYHSWAEYGAWFASLMKDRAVPDEAIQRKADELTRGLTTDDARIDALYQYVATQYRYISVSLGIGRVQPHTAAEVFRNQYGDCKDKHTLLQAMLAAEKIEAIPVLISANTRLNPALPMSAQFNHMITLVQPGPRQVWLDTTPEVAPSRLLLAQVRDKQALAIPAHGEAYLVTTPATSPFPSYFRQSVTGSLDIHGTLTAHFEQTTRGDSEVLLRSAFRMVPRARWQELEQSIARNVGLSGDVSAVDASLPEKTTEPFQIRWDYTHKLFGDWPNRKVASLSISMGIDIPAESKAPERPLALQQDEPAENHVVLTLPEGYTAIAPPNTTRKTDFAEYTCTSTVKGRTLQVDRRLEYKVHELPVSAWPAFREFQKAVSDDNVRMLQLIGADARQSAQTQSLVEDKESAGLLAQAEERMKVNDLAAAGSLIDQVAHLNEQAYGLWVAKGNLAWRHGAMAEAIADYTHELDRNPEMFWVYGSLTAAYIHQGDWKHAEETEHAWSKADPADPRPKAQLGYLLAEQGRYPEAVRAYTDAIAVSTDPEVFTSALGSAQLKAGQVDKGKATLRALLEKSDNPGMLNDAAYALADADLDLDAAEAASRKSVDVLETRAAGASIAAPQQEYVGTLASLSASWDTLGWIDFKQHKLAEAESYLRSAWLLTPRADIALHLAQTYEAEGKKPDALKVLRLGLATIRGAQPPATVKQTQVAMEAQLKALKAEGVTEPRSESPVQGGDEVGALRTFTMANPLAHREYASADFLILLGAHGAEEVRFLRGSETLRPLESALRTTDYRDPLPQGSKAKLLRPGIVACTTGSPTCLLVLLPLAETHLGS